MLESGAGTRAMISRAAHRRRRTLQGAHRRRRPWIVLALCCVAQFMLQLDVSIVTVALPVMRSSFGLSGTSIQWVVNAYALTFAGLLLLGGRAADLFGRRRVFLLGLCVFTASSLIGGLAQSAGWLIAARAAQGIGAALLAPSTLALLTTTFVDPVQRRRALGAWAATAASGVAIVTDVLGWRWVLFVNVPIGATLLAVAAIALAEPRASLARRRLDLAGAITATLGLAILVYGTLETETREWGSTATIVTLAVGAALLAAFTVIEGRVAAHPLVPLSLFRRRALSAANLVAVTIGAAQFGTYVFLALYLQRTLRYTPLQSGLAVLPAGIATITGSLLGARVLARLGLRRQLALAMLLPVLGLFWLSQLAAHASYLHAILVPSALAGLGFGLSYVPLTMAATGGLPAEQAGLASALITSARQIGGAVGLAAMATVAVNATRNHHARANATALAVGYDRAFTLAAATVLAGAAIATALPSGADPRTRRANPNRASQLASDER
jgi:EmrB/QacA subfamily drug resistance transporter